MKKNVWIYGLIIGTILCINMIIMINRMYNEPNFKSNDIAGYTAMVVLFSLIFLGVRNYRNKFLNGSISFGRAFKTGALIALVSSTMYVIVGLSYYHLFAPDFLDVYANYVIRNSPPAEAQEKAAEMATFKEMYKNPVFAILITYSEVLPVGLVVALVSALILKKKINNNNNALTGAALQDK